jgi:hypothetical protein
MLFFCTGLRISLRSIYLDFTNCCENPINNKYFKFRIYENDTGYLFPGIVKQRLELEEIKFINCQKYLAVNRPIYFSLEFL